MLSYLPFRENQMRVNDENDTWLVLTSWGRRGFSKSHRDSWVFDGSLKLQQRDTATDFDFVQLARDSFVAMAGRQEQWPSGIKFVCVHCDTFSLVATDDAQEAIVPVHGFHQKIYLKICKWEMWLPSP